MWTTLSRNIRNTHTMGKNEKKSVMERKPEKDKQKDENNIEKVCMKEKNFTFLEVF